MICLYGFKAYLQCTSGVHHSMVGISGKIHDHLVNLGGICHYRSAAWIKILYNLNIGWKRSFYKVHYFNNYLMHLKWLFIHFNLPAECENLLNQIFCSYCRIVDLFNIIHQVTVFIKFLHCHFSITKDGGQDIIKIVSNSTSQGTNGFHFL